MSGNKKGEDHLSWNLFSRFKVVAAKKRRADFAFVNIIMTDVRNSSVQQKLKSFYTIIERSMSEGKSVNVVVFLDKKNIEKAFGTYRELLGCYLGDDLFNLYMVYPRWRLLDRFYIFACAVFLFLKLNGSACSRFNFSFLIAASKSRINNFIKLYDALPCQNWLGLTGGVELPSLWYRKKQLNREGGVGALQFGQASAEQIHFSGYEVDAFFAYDEISAGVYSRLGVNNVVVSGSPEFEHYSSNVRDDELSEENKLNIIFVDQPITQRGEYTNDFILGFYCFLRELNGLDNVRFVIKRHPRGSAFESMDMHGFAFSDDWEKDLSKSHVAVGFFSNLLEFSLICGRATLYVGSRQILGREKSEWISSLGGVICDDLDGLRREIQCLRLRFQDLAPNIASRRKKTTDRLPSDIILRKLVDGRESKRSS